MTWKKLKKFEDWNVGLIGIVAIFMLLLGVFLGATYGFKEEQKKYPIPTELTEQEIRDNLLELFTDKDNLMRELHSTNLLIEIYSADYEARQNNLSVKYQRVGTQLARIEYNGSAIEDITISQETKEKEYDSREVSFPKDFIQRVCPIELTNGTCYNLNKSFADNQDFFFYVNAKFDVHNKYYQEGLVRQGVTVIGGNITLTQYRVSDYLWNETAIQEMSR